MTEKQADLRDKAVEDEDLFDDLATDVDKRQKFHITKTSRVERNAQS